MSPKIKSPLDYILSRLEDPEFAAHIQSVLTRTVTDIESQTAHVQTVIPLTDSQEKLVDEFIRRRFPQALAIDYQIDPELLAGLRIRVGDYVLDSSLSSQLADLQKNIT